ncbi:MAG: hypothetical protein ACW7DY_18750, partial [Paraglaciecola chathamensis]
MILKHCIKALAFSALTCVSAFALTARAVPSAPANWPNIQYDNAIPDMQTVLGYSAGQRITSHPDMLRF